MCDNVATILAAAEKLTVAQRRELIELLELGLDDDTPPLSDAWKEVIAARLADYHAGRVEAVPWSEVLARWAKLPASGGRPSSRAPDVVTQTGPPQSGCR